MAENTTDALSTNGPSSELESFEQDISDILRDDAPDLGDMSSVVQGGSNTEIDIGTSGQLPGSFYGNESPGQQSQGGSGQISKSRLTRSHTVPIATSNLSSSHSNGDFIPKSHIQNAQSRLESLKDWSLNTYKCTKQYLSERLGKGSRTVDAELQSKIDNLRETQKKYQIILRLTRAMSSHFYHVVQTQRLLGETFSDLSQKSPELQDEFTYNCETQRTLVRNGETLLGALNFFTSSVNTLVNKTMEDTVITIRQYESARLEFDAYRNDLDTLQLAPKDVPNNTIRLDEARQKYEDHKTKFDQLRQDVAIKLKFLDENKVKVMHKQLLLFHNAVSGYFSGNQTGLEATLKQFSITLHAPNSEAPSWLEQ